jgi:hypothetical protein
LSRKLFLLPLAEITATKSFLSLRAYPGKVKAAAARPLVTLKSKVVQVDPDTI